ncbi:hypothetical protein LEN26_020981 [Aphanomyces euteiches]|nr:hypothetical protein LEN26_020981 [Aphanomyces euteiches]KAH9126043.1 hypothetical protein AeMF1_003461 [Aphanomyces euteiches]KAH9192319.1 hypothetical protein AeNC1_005704 [Aphanomyces euteiches]
MSMRRNRSGKVDAGAQKIVLSGWMRKQKAHLKTWNRRFFALSGSTLSYYDSEDISGAPRGVIDVASVHPLPSEANGLLIHCKAGRDEKLICDTNVAYNAWFALLTRATNPESVFEPPPTDAQDNNALDDALDDDESTEAITYRPNPIKMGYVHVHYASTTKQTAEEAVPPPEDADTWNRYFCKVEHDLLNCYSDDTQQHLYVSGMVRNVTLYEGRKYALSVGLNKGRTVILCCDSMEEKTNWLLTLEGALKTAYKVIQARRQQYGGHSGLLRQSSHIYDLDLAPEDQMVIPPPAAAEASLVRVDEDDEDDNNSEASGVWI